MHNQETDQNSIEIQHFLDGYHQRDQRLAGHFFYVVQVFALFIVILGTAKILIPNTTWKLITIILLFIIVSMAIISFIADIQANISCKNALRKRMEDLNSDYWNTINNRKKGYLEKIIKQNEASLGTFYIITSYLILIAWIIFCVTTFFF